MDNSILYAAIAATAVIGAIVWYFWPEDEALTAESDGKFTTLADTLVFAVRGTLTARYSSGGATGFASGAASVTVAADAGALSGSSIQWAANNSIKGVSWPGRSNTPNGRAISILFRYRPGYTGAPASNHSLFSLSTLGGRGIIISVQHLTTSGNVSVTITNETQAAVLSAQSFGAWSPTSGTWYDIVFTWDGTTAANAIKVYVDAALLGQATGAAEFTASWTNQYFDSILLGVVNAAGSINSGRVDEVVIWGNVIDPTAVTLESGSGSLNGASRTSLVSATAFDGSTYTDPGIGNVRSGTGYTYAGSSLTGTLDVSSGSSVIQLGGPGAMWRN